MPTRGKVKEWHYRRPNNINYMKIIIQGLALVLISSMGCVDLVAQNIQIVHPITGNELDSNDLPNYVQFRVVNLTPPPPNPNSNQPPSWGYLWTFGDCSLPSTQSAPLHMYDPQQGNYDVKLILTPKYADEDEELPLFSKSIGVNGPFTTQDEANAEYDFEPGKSITAEAVRDCKPGDVTTFIIHFKNPDNNSYPDPKVKFFYNAQMMSFDTTYVDGCGYSSYSHGVNSTGDEGLLTFHLPELGADEEGFLTLSLLTQTQAPLGAELRFKSELHRNSSGNLTSDHLLFKEVKNSHDPNDKSVTETADCSIDSLVYTIRFENEGTTNAQLVYIMDEIDRQLDINSIRILGTSHASNALSIIDSISLSSSFNPHFLPYSHVGNTLILRDTVLRKLAYVHSHIDLPPSGWIPSVEGGSVATGQGYFQYSIQLDTQALQTASPLIGSHAQIYFDNNHAITTNAPMVSRAQCYCEPVFNNAQLQWIQALQLNAINHTSGNDGGYANYRRLETPLTIGNYHSVTLTPGFLSSTPSSVYWRIYIDVDRNGQFDSYESVFSGSGSSPITGNVSIPTSALPGPTAMRVVMSDVPFGGGCMQPIDGEIEDYSVTLQHPLLPDLEIVDRTISPYRITKGSSVSSTYIVRNQGLDSLKSASSVRYYLSPDIHFDSTDYFLTSQAIPSMGAQTEINGSVNITFPSWLEGNQYVILVVDDQQMIPESDETNNASLLKIWVGKKQADLLLKKPKTCQKYFKAGASFDIDFEIENQGLASAISTSGGIPIALYLSENRKLDANDTPLDTCWLDSIPSDTSFPYTLGSQLPTQLIHGKYFLILQFDPDNLIIESHENNNLARVAIIHSGTKAAKIPYYTGFECGNTSVSWILEDSLVSRVLVADTANPFADSFHLLLKPSATGTASWIDLKLNLSNAASQPHFLSFHWKDFDTSQTDTFNGLYLSDDGTHFIKAFDLNSTSIGWQPECLSFDSIADTHQLNLNSLLWVRFQIRGTSSAQLAIDELTVSTTNCSAGNMPYVQTHVSSPPSLGMSLYPNPGFQHTNLEYWSENDEALISLEIRDLTGRLVQQPFQDKKHNQGLYQIQLHSLPAGQYLCVLRSESDLATKNLVIMR